jgi:hypothetical protein
VVEEVGEAEGVEDVEEEAEGDSVWQVDYLDTSLGY